MFIKHHLIHMASLKNCSLVFFFFMLNQLVAAEIYPLSTIVDLSIKSDTIVEANYLSTANDSSYFLIYGFYGDESDSDTLILPNLAQYYDNLELLENSEQIIIYLKKEEGGRLHSLMSGFRILLSGKVHLALQTVIPGKYSFVESFDGIGWGDLKKNIHLAQVRINEVKKIKESEDNKKLLQWISNEGENLAKRGGRNENVGWGTYGLEVFRWITERNVAADTWEAARLYREIHFPDENVWLGYTGILNDYNGSSFKTYEDIDFLISKAINNDESTIVRRQALLYLSDAARLVYKNNHPVPQAEVLNEQTRHQKHIRDQILPLLQMDELKQYAFPAIRIMSNPMDGNLRHRIDLEVMPILKRKYETEESGEFKSTLAKFLAFNLSNEEWKEISNCDAGIFVDLYSLLVERKNQSLSFYLNVRNGRKPFVDLPRVEIVNQETGVKVYEQDLVDFNFEKIHYGGQFIIVHDLNIQEGFYKVRVVGAAGNESQHHWETPYFKFVWE